MTWHIYLKMNNTELAHSLMDYHGSNCDCLNGPEAKRCRFWHLTEEIVRRLTEGPREPFYDSPKGPAN
jgi:hypothetical protein